LGPLVGVGLVCVGGITARRAYTATERPSKRRIKKSQYSKACRCEDGEDGRAMGGSTPMVPAQEDIQQRLSESVSVIGRVARRYGRKSGMPLIEVTVATPVSGSARPIKLAAEVVKLSWASTASAEDLGRALWTVSLEGEDQATLAEWIIARCCQAWDGERADGGAGQAGESPSNPIGAARVLRDID